MSFRMRSRRGIKVAGGGGEPTLPNVASAALELRLDSLIDIASLDDDDLISAFEDQSGHNRDFTATGDARPIKQTFDSIPFAVPDGIGNWMDGGVFADNLTSFVVFLVMRYTGAGGATLNKLDVNADWEYNGWLVKNDGGLALEQQAPAGDEQRLSQTQNNNVGIGEAHLVTMEKIDNTELHCYLDGVLNDGFDPADLSGDPITSTTNSETVKLWVEGGVNGVDDNDYSNIPVAAISLYRITDIDNWPTDRSSIHAWLSVRYKIYVPRFVSATIGLLDALTVQVNLNRNVSAADFSDGVTIKVNDVAADIDSSSLEGNHAIIDYVLVDPVLPLDVVTWEYSQAGGNIINEENSTPMEDVSPREVTNYITP